MMWWGDGSWGFGSWAAMALMMVVVLGAGIVLGVGVIRGFTPGRRTLRQRAGSGLAEQKLAERFARGEIDEAQFTRARAILHDDKTQA